MSNDQLRMIPILNCQARDIRYSCHYEDGCLRDVVRLEQEPSAKQRFVFNVNGFLQTIGQNHNKVYTQSEPTFDGMPLMLFTVGESFISERPHRKGGTSYRLDRRDGSMSGLTFYRQGNLLYHLILEIYFDHHRQSSRQLFKYVFPVHRSGSSHIHFPLMHYTDALHFFDYHFKKNLVMD